MENAIRPWPAFGALMIGFFMILVDSTIVSVANPTIVRSLDTDISGVIWVTSAYLLAYVVPLLVTGRLGDRYGPKRIYLIGLVVFTLSSVWCGLSGDIVILIIARVVQGFGAAMMAPQTMAVVTRIFPSNRRGVAMGLWGSVGGIAVLAGPILGGLLVDSLGWEWVFFVNVPVGVIGFILALRLVPNLPIHAHRFDWLGVLLSATGMFLLVFGIQEGSRYDWGTIVGPISIPALIITGIVVLIGFVVWQHFNPAEPLVPLRLFRDRNFSLASLAISFTGLAITALPLPLVFYFQLTLGLSPTASALMLGPTSVISAALSPFIGKLVDRINPKYLTVAGFILSGLSLVGYAIIMKADTPVWLLLLPSAVLGAGLSAVWSPVASTATRNLPLHQAGAGAGIYNTTRQVGAVLGSAAIAALMSERVAEQLPGMNATQIETLGVNGGGAIPQKVLDSFGVAMGESMILPAVALFAGALVALFFAKPHVTSQPKSIRAPQDS